MNIIVDAVFEDGVLKPLGPIALAEHERVRVSIQSEGSANPDNSDPAVLARQHEAIKALLAKTQQMPIETIQHSLEGQLGQSLTQATKEAVAIAWYQTEKLSIGQVAELLGISVYEAEGLMKEHHVEAPYSLDDYEQDRQTLDRLLNP